MHEEKFDCATIEPGTLNAENSNTIHCFNEVEEIKTLASAKCERRKIAQVCVREENLPWTYSEIHVEEASGER